MIDTAQTPRNPPPPRPSRSVERLTIYTSSSTSPSTPPLLPSTGYASASPESPMVQTPTTPTQAHHRVGNRKSISNIRRKPVPVTSDEFDVELSTLQFSSDGNGVSLPSTPLTPTPTRPPTYPYGHATAARSHMLMVDPPLYPADEQDPFRTPHTSAAQSRATLPDFDMTVHGSRPSGEQLPTYAVETETEPATLARGLWRFGFVIPILWIIGMCM